MMDNLLNSYINGNCKVSIYDDGTKVREYDGEPSPIHPESMDIKITNYCSGSEDQSNLLCKWCHERSNLQGKHAEFSALLNCFDNLSPGVEICLGGGDTFSYPHLKALLSALEYRKLIANTTVNQRHVKMHSDKIKKYLQEKLIYGLGISYSDSKYLPDIKPIINLTDNIVFHVIMGLNDVDVIGELNSFCKEQGKQCKVLILGYKEYGLGKNYYESEKEKIDESKLQWYRYLPKYFKDENLTISFDNLAIKQLNLKRFFTDKGWEKFYLGNDGQFTMYVDAVKQEYAVSSTHTDRVSFNDMSLLEFFKKISIK